MLQVGVATQSVLACAQTQRTKQGTGASAAHTPTGSREARVACERPLEGQPAPWGPGSMCSMCIPSCRPCSLREGRVGCRCAGPPRRTHHTRLISGGHGSGWAGDASTGCLAGTHPGGRHKVVCGLPASPGRRAVNRPRVPVPTCSAVWQRRYRKRRAGRGRDAPERPGSVYTTRSTDGFQVTPQQHTRRPAGRPGAETGAGRVEEAGAGVP